MRTKDKLPYTAFSGEVVKKELVLNLASKELFTVKRQLAFKTSIAQAIADSTGMTAADLVDAVIIESVCDSSGCINYVARRSTSGSITVKYQVQGRSGVNLDDVTTALESDNFVNTFTQKMADNGSPVTASLPSANTGTPTPPPSDTTTSAPGTTIDGAASRSHGSAGWILQAFMLLLLSVGTCRLTCWQ